MFCEVLLPKCIDIDKIYLDVSNPRFLGDPRSPINNPHNLEDEKAQESTRRFLLEKYGVGQLIESIKRVGFLNIDKIIVRKIKEDVYVVVEGNRRVAAIKTILAELKCNAVTLPESIIQTISRINTLELSEDVEDSEFTVAFLQGIRHISGVKSWGPYQQGKLLELLVETKGYNLTEASLSVGLSPGRVATILRAYQGLVQMQNDSTYRTLANINLFSHFEQAYVKLPIRNWLEWDKETKRYINRKNLHTFYEMITIQGYRGQEIRDFFPEVLESDEAYSAFIYDGCRLSEAYFMTQPHNNKVESLLKSATKTLKNINNSGIIPTEKEQEMIQQIHEISKLILQGFGTTK